MRSTLGQARLNHLMVTAIHGGKLEELDISKLMSEFILRTTSDKKLLLFLTESLKCIN